MATDDLIYLRDLDGSGSMHVCAAGDPGAVAYVRDGKFDSIWRLYTLQTQGISR